MEEYKISIDGPQFYKDSKYKFYNQGNSPQLLRELIDYLRSHAENIEEVYCCLYLFNNRLLHDEFKKLAKDFGVNVKIVSIPLEGYDNDKPQYILDLNSGKPIYPERKTKYNLAKEIYSEFIEENFPNNYQLFVFPHMYLRSPRVRGFSRGQMPYSLHAKTLFIKYKNGSGAVILTSSNLAVRDLIKNEIMIFILSDNERYNTPASDFFQNLLTNSISISKFDENENWFNFKIQVKKYNHSPHNFYLAPFYEDSPEIAEKYLIDLISVARKRVYISAQHICSYNYTYPDRYKEGSGHGNKQRPGMLAAVLDAGDRGIDVRLLSQTYVDEDGSDHGCRKPENQNSFKAFIREFKGRGFKNYAANQDVHWKFIIADDTVVITTCNFTPTQFIYLKHVDITKFDNISDVSYKGIHAEVGQYIILKSKEIADILTEHFSATWDSQDSYRLDCKDKVCSKCGNKMVMRSSCYGRFWGCAKFPQCKYTENI